VRTDLESTAMAVPETQIHRYSLDEYHQLVCSGGFNDDTRVELIDGWLVDMSPKTRAHENAIRWLTRWLTQALDFDRFELGVQTALTIGNSEPEPDLSVVPLDAPRPYHPATATLVIEIAVSSQDRDLRVKPAVYASANVAEYWVVDLDGSRVVVHTTLVAGRYQLVTEVPPSGTATASALQLPPVGVAELLAAANH
jgi:Uma2 family endonuclease